MQFRYILIAITVMNVIAFILYGADKRRAIRKQRRIRESTLLLFAAVYGAVGALLAMFIFRHKTRHRKFTVLVPIFMILQSSLLIFCATYIQMPM